MCYASNGNRQPGMALMMATLSVRATDGASLIINLIKPLFYGAKHFARAGRD